MILQKRRLSAAGRADEDDELAVLRPGGRCPSARRPCRRIFFTLSMVSAAHTGRAQPSPPPSAVPPRKRVAAWNGSSARSIARFPFVRGREADGERAHRVVHVAREIDVLADRLQQIGLLAVAKLLMVRLVRRRDVLGRASRNLPSAPIAALWMRSMVGLAVGVDVIRAHALVHDDRDAAAWRDHVLHEIGGLRHHRPQPASYQPTEPSSNSTCRWP